MGERGFCEPNWQPDSTVNQFLDGLDYGLRFPFIQETMGEHSAKRTAQRQQTWQKEKEFCDEVERSLDEAIMRANMERMLEKTQRILALEIAERAVHTGYNNARYHPLRGSHAKNYEGMQPNARQEREEEAFYKRGYQ